jgi:hypothetical protein
VGGPKPALAEGMEKLYLPGGTPLLSLVLTYLFGYPTYCVDAMEMNKLIGICMFLLSRLGSWAAPLCRVKSIFCKHEMQVLYLYLFGCMSTLSFSFEWTAIKIYTTFILMNKGYIFLRSQTI